MSEPAPAIVRAPRIVCVTDVGLRRPHNEDTFSVLPALGLCAVADGMGGHVGGEIASRLAITTLESRGGGHPAHDRRRDTAADLAFLAEGVLEANALIFARGSSDDQLRDMGTTIVAGLFRPDYAVIVNVGDSRLYRLRRGELEQLTVDHSWVGELLRKNLLTKTEAMHHPLKNIITRALGMGAYVDVDTAALDVAAGDRYLLCTDGLTDLVTDGEILHTLSAPDRDLERMARALVALANEHGGLDNVTVGLVAYDEEEGARGKGSV